MSPRPGSPIPRSEGAPKRMTPEGKAKRERFVEQKRQLAETWAKGEVGAQPTPIEEFKMPAAEAGEVPVAVKADLPSLEGIAAEEMRARRRSDVDAPATEVTQSPKLEEDTQYDISEDKTVRLEKKVWTPEKETDPLAAEVAAAKAVADSTFKDRIRMPDLSERDVAARVARVDLMAKNIAEATGLDLSRSGLKQQPMTVETPVDVEAKRNWETYTKSIKEEAAKESAEEAEELIALRAKVTEGKIAREALGEAPPGIRPSSKAEDLLARMREGQAKKLEQIRKDELGVTRTKSADDLIARANETRRRLEKEKDIDALQEMAAAEQSLEDALRQAEQERSSMTVEQLEDSTDSMMDIIDGLQAKLKTASGEIRAGIVDQLQQAIQGVELNAREVAKRNKEVPVKEAIAQETTMSADQSEQLTDDIMAQVESKIPVKSAVKSESTLSEQESQALTEDIMAQIDGNTPPEAPARAMRKEGAKTPEMIREEQAERQIHVKDIAAYVDAARSWDFAEMSYDELNEHLDDIESAEKDLDTYIGLEKNDQEEVARLRGIQKNLESIGNDIYDQIKAAVAEETPTAEQTPSVELPKDVKTELKEESEPYGGFESREDWERAQDLAKQIEELKANASKLGAREYNAQKASLMAELMDVLGSDFKLTTSGEREVRPTFEASEQAPIEAEEPEEAAETPSAFDQLKKNKAADLRVSSKLSSYLQKNFTGNARAVERLNRTTKDQNINLRFLGVASNGEYRFIDPTLENKLGDETSAMEIRLPKDLVAEVLSEPEDLSVQGVAGTRTPIRQASNEPQPYERAA